MCVQRVTIAEIHAPSPAQVRLTCASDHACRTPQPQSAAPVNANAREESEAGPTTPAHAVWRQASDHPTCWARTTTARVRRAPAIEHVATGVSVVHWLATSRVPIANAGHAPGRTGFSAAGRAWRITTRCCSICILARLERTLEGVLFSKSLA